MGISIYSSNNRVPPVAPGVSGNVFIAHLSCATHRLPLLAIAVALLPDSRGAQQAEPRGWWQIIRDKTDEITAVHENDLYLSGDIHHGRHAHTAERVRALNERHAWGAGVGKTLRNDGGDEESLSAFGSSDSHYPPQLMAAALVGGWQQWRCTVLFCTVWFRLNGNTDCKRVAGVFFNTNCKLEQGCIK